MEALKASSIKYSVLVFILSLLLCKSLQGQILPYKNPSLQIEERVNDLLKRMTMDDFTYKLLTNKDMLICNQNVVTGFLVYDTHNIAKNKAPVRDNPAKG